MTSTPRRGRHLSGDDLPAVRRDRDCSFAAGLTAVTFRDRVRDLNAGTLVLEPHAPVAVALPPDWSADPLGDTNWRFQFHSLRWAQTLKRSYDRSGDAHDLQRWLLILEDWYRRNPWTDPPSDQSWADHSTALRARVYAACAQALGDPWPTWLRLALHEHVDVLSGSDIYPTGGNHALNQNVGLFAAATMLGRTTERRFAVERTADLLERSVDEQGVTDEQSTEYQVYNHRRYREAAELFRAGGEDLPAVFDRIDLMPDLIAHATLPSGRDAMIGDACDDPAHVVAGTITEFAASAGARGPRPTDRHRVFDRGYVFARTGWGDTRPFDQETHLSVRFGAARVPHGHHDAGSVALYGRGTRILVNAGKYGYTWDAFRAYVLSRRAQNSVSFVDRPYGPDGGSELEEVTADERVLVIRIRDLHHPDVDHRRIVAFDLESGDLAVVDRFATLDGAPATAEQRLRLDPQFAVSEVTADRVSASHPLGVHVSLVQHVPVDSWTCVSGATEPLDGWVSYRYGERTPTNTCVASLTRPSGTFVTSIVARREDEEVAGTTAYDAATDLLSIGGRSVDIA